MGDGGASTIHAQADVPEDAADLCAFPGAVGDQEDGVPQINISDKTVRIWAQNHGHQVGMRGPLSRQTIDAYVAYHEQPLLLRIANLEQQLTELRAESAEDKAVIKAQQRCIKDLEREKRTLEFEVEDWKQISVQLATAVHSSD